MTSKNLFWAWVAAAVVGEVLGTIVSVVALLGFTIFAALNMLFWAPAIVEMVNLVISIPTGAIALLCLGAAAAPPFRLWRRWRLAILLFLVLDAAAIELWRRAFLSPTAWAPPPAIAGVPLSAALFPWAAVGAALAFALAGGRPADVGRAAAWRSSIEVGIASVAAAVIAHYAVALALPGLEWLGADPSVTNLLIPAEAAFYGALSGAALVRHARQRAADPAPLTGGAHAAPSEAGELAGYVGERAWRWIRVEAVEYVRWCVRTPLAALLGGQLLVSYLVVTGTLQHTAPSVSTAMGHLFWRVFFPESGGNLSLHLEGADVFTFFLRVYATAALALRAAALCLQLVLHLVAIRADAGLPLAFGRSAGDAPDAPPRLPQGRRLAAVVGLAGASQAALLVSFAISAMRTGRIPLLGAFEVVAAALCIGLTYAAARVAFALDGPIDRLIAAIRRPLTSAVPVPLPTAPQPITP